MIGFFRDRRGHVAVEYALTFPYLVALIYGILELSHYAYIQMTVANIAHDAARYAVVHSSVSSQPLLAADIGSFVNSRLSGLGFNTNGHGGTAVTVTYSPDNTPGSTVSVNISYTFVPFMAGFNAVPGSTHTFTPLTGSISGKAQMVLNP
ncbi:MAG TPA: TadE/TadG family type IV pilus assembly protein [Alphaproteobacteria bacterium]|jgi:Flp pilus assembly protein TadG|nr:TadE/TadG family type IV pilus assembly protein [Alphaproteobacteria bacterium]